MQYPIQFMPNNKFLYLTILILFITYGCGKKIHENVYSVKTVFVNSLNQPVNLDFYEGDKLSRLSILANDSLIAEEKNEEKSPSFLWKSDSCELALQNGQYKTDYLCSRYMGDKTVCNNAMANILSINQYHYFNKNGVYTYRYVISAKDSLEIIMRR